MILARMFLSIEFFVVGHFLAGVIAAYKVVLFIYIAECAPDDRRGIATMTIGSGAAVVMLLIQPLCFPSIFGNNSSWWGLPAVCLGQAVIHLFVGSMFPKSPKHLFITEGKRDEAIFAVRFYHGDEADIGKQNSGN